MTVPRKEPPCRAGPPQVGPNLTSLEGCSVQDGTGWSRDARRRAAAALRAVLEQPVPSCDRLAVRCREGGFTREAGIGTAPKRKLGPSALA